MYTSNQSYFGFSFRIKLNCNSVLRCGDFNHRNHRTTRLLGVVFVVVVVVVVVVFREKMIENCSYFVLVLHSLLSSPVGQRQWIIHPL